MAKTIQNKPSDGRYKISTIVTEEEKSMITELAETYRASVAWTLRKVIRDAYEQNTVS